MTATQPDAAGPATEIAQSQIELTPNVFAASLEAAIAAHEIAASGQPQPIEEPISASLTEPEPPADTPAAAEQRDEPPMPPEPTPVEPNEGRPESAVRRMSLRAGAADEMPSGAIPDRRKQPSSRAKNSVSAGKKRPTERERTEIPGQSGSIRPSPTLPPNRKGGHPPRKSWRLIATGQGLSRRRCRQGARHQEMRRPWHECPPSGRCPAGSPARRPSRLYGRRRRKLYPLVVMGGRLYSASIMTAKLLAANRTGQRGPLPESVVAARADRGLARPHSTWHTGRSS